MARAAGRVESVLLHLPWWDDEPQHQEPGDLPAGGRARQTHGETMTGALALRERLEREHRRRDVDVRVAKLLAIGERCAKRLAPGPSAAEHGDLLYDEQGLPT